MTTTIVIGTQTAPQSKNPIVFEKYLESGGRVCCADSFKPREFNYIELIATNYDDNNDLMFAYHNPDRRGSGVLFLGKWNDGIV